MQLLSDIVRDTDENLGLESKTPVLVAEAVRFLFDAQHGGLEGFLERLEKEGLGADLSNWRNPLEEIRFSEGHRLEVLLGADTISRMGRDLGMANARVRTALAYVIPRLIRYFTAGGNIPEQVPHAVTDYLSTHVHGLIAPRSRAIRSNAKAKRKKASTSPAWTVRVAWGSGVGVLLISSFFLGRDIYERTPHGQPEGSTPEPVASSSGPVVSQDAGAKQPEAQGAGSKLVIRNNGGHFEFLGFVNTAQSRQTILEKLQKSFGAGKIAGDILVDPSRSDPLWINQLDRLFPLLNVPGLDVRLEGNTLRVGGWLSEEDRNGILNSLMSTLGANYRYGYLRDEGIERAQDSKQYMAAVLAHIGSDAKPAEVVSILNRWIINFADGAAVFPEDSREIATKVASVIQNLRTSALYEIQGHVDSEPNRPQAIKLSTARANAVRDALIQGGVAEGKLRTKGFGGDKRLPGGEPQTDQARNERIEFRVIQICDPYFPCDYSSAPKRPSLPDPNVPEPEIVNGGGVDKSEPKAAAPSQPVPPSVEKPVEHPASGQPEAGPSTSRLRSLSEELPPQVKPKTKPPEAPKPADPKQPEWYDPLGIF